MLLSEAKEILKKNGYKLVEAYNAVEMHRREKGGVETQGPMVDTETLLAKALRREFPEFKVSYSMFLSHITIKDPETRKTLWEISVDLDMDAAHDNDDESEDVTVQFNRCEVTIIPGDYSANASKKFDCRNIPAMTKFISEYINKHR